MQSRWVTAPLALPALRRLLVLPAPLVRPGPQEPLALPALLDRLVLPVPPKLPAHPGPRVPDNPLSVLYTRGN
jgi:hypothetical protein